MSYTATETPAGRRIAALLDEGSFAEIGGEVTARSTDFNLQEKKTPSDGVITGYGLIDGNLVYVYSQDPDVLNGSMGEMHAKKIGNIYDMAIKMGAPVIGLIDCAGFRLQESTDALDAFGNLYRKQTNASGVVPQITAIFGMCGGGLAVVPGLADFTFMEKNTGRMFINSPNTLDGNSVSDLDTANAAYQSSVSGLIDGIGTENEILEQIRSLVCMIPSNYEDGVLAEPCTDDLNRICGDIENGAEDGAYVLSRIADGQIFFELKSNYAKEMAVGFIRLNGTTVGAVANRSRLYGPGGAAEESYEPVLTVNGCRKAADFVKFCDAFSIPVLSVTRAEGYAADVESEKNMAKAAAELTYAFAEATVPKVNLITGKAYGSAYLTMNSKSIGADLVYAWPSSEIGMMDAGMAARIMYADADMSVIREKEKEYRELQSSPFSAAGRGYVDAIIQPSDTRKYVIGAFEMLFTKRERRPDKKHGTV